MFYRRQGLLITLRNDAGKIRSKCIVSPHFVNLLLELEKNKWDPQLWDNLSQIERNFMYELNQKCLKNRDVEFQHLNDCNRPMNRLRILDGELLAGNISKGLIKEFKELVDELFQRHQISGPLKNVMKKKADHIEQSYNLY